MTDGASTPGDSLADTPALPRHARDVRLTGRGGAGALEGSWAGVRRPFGGVLVPGLSTGEWPPPVLSHLTLAALLADALGPTAGGTTDGRPSSSGQQPSPAEPAGEPTVSEVLRTAPGSASPVDDATTVLPDRQDPDRTTAPSAADLPDEPATGPSRDGEAESDLVGPRTVLRPVATWPDSPPETTERWIARLAESDEPPGRAATGSTAASDSPSSGGRAGSSPDGSRRPSVPSSWTAPPVDRTVAARVPAVGDAGVFGGGDTTGAATDPWVDPSSAEERPVEGNRPESPGSDAVPWDDADGRHPSGDSFAPESAPGPDRDGRATPAMTVRRGPPGSAEEDGRRSRGAARSPGIDPGGSDAGFAAGVAASPTTPGSSAATGTPDPGAGEPGDTRGSGRDAMAGDVVERSVADAVTDPRVVDRLHRELERRRRIERERGGRP